MHKKLETFAIHVIDSLYGNENKKVIILSQSRPTNHISAFVVSLSIIQENSKVCILITFCNVMLVVIIFLFALLLL